ncbi:MAG: Fic family protein [Pseudohongiellaceae bacterium]
MAKPVPEEALATIELLVAAHPGGISYQDIQDQLQPPLPRRTLQSHLKRLVGAGRLVMDGEKRWAQYRMPAVQVAYTGKSRTEKEPATPLQLSKSAIEIQNYVRQPMAERTPVSYKREFLDAYKPNTDAWFSDKECTHLQQIGMLTTAEQPAGTFARQILDRLLIDLSWNSSRLEGNTYSLLETRRLIEFSEETAGKGKTAAQMILNHKDAIEFLVESAEQINLNRHTILNLHALLADNLLDNSRAVGDLRRIMVEIGMSTYHPSAVPQFIDECFNQVLTTASAITNPFEQALFALAQLPYLQPFEDVNKRVSRLAANIPLIKANLIPLSFTRMPTRIYTEAMLGVYEMNRIDLLKEVFIWAYELSAEHYKVVRQTLGEADPFRLKHRNALKEIVNTIVIERLNRKSTYARIAEFAEQHIGADEVEQFREVTEDEVLALHEGNYARYQVTLAKFQAWQTVWNNKPDTPPPK